MEHQSPTPPFRISVFTFAVVSWLQIPAAVFLVALLKRGVEPTNPWAWLLGLYLAASVAVQTWLRPSVADYGEQYIEEMKNPDENQNKLALTRLGGFLEMAGLACICFGWANSDGQFVKGGIVLFLSGACILVWKAYQER